MIHQYNDNHYWDLFVKAMREIEEQKGRPKERSFKTFYYQGRKYKQWVTRMD